ncbi:hypothetical protein RJ639_037374 [Escallonia herrerae]|uniref:Phospho-2-dehydro-3-deoxyheptonate aldolase n=1 Tax=Escallonia herrerae TaxID=1293975 RepID=A0AA88WPB9_9ASTE|nr:hypothetical protein RJ639_037374 [Escallonia herrerae]
MALSNVSALSSTGFVHRPISLLHAAEPANNSATIDIPKKANPSEVPVTWTVESWKSKKVLQIPEYPDEAELESVLRTLEGFPPLVFAGEARNLEERLAEAAVGRALQGGDCAESFKEFSANNIRNTFRVLLQMGVVLMFGGQMPVIKVGRMAGQFAKPRSGIYEEKDEVRLPIYKRDMINGDAFDEKSRVADPQKMIRAYCQAAATLNRRYQELAQRVDEALGFMSAAGLTIDHPIMATTEFWTSHECLLLTYEQAFTRQDSTSGLYCDCSAHMLWVGGLEVIVLLMLIYMHDIVTYTLLYCLAHDRAIVSPTTLDQVAKYGTCIMSQAEVQAFFDAHKQEGSHPGGIHLEMMAQNATECVAGSCNVTYDDISTRYHTHCDPRLNASQSLELAFIIAEQLWERRLGAETLDLFKS